MLDGVDGGDQFSLGGVLGCLVYAPILTVGNAVEEVTSAIVGKTVQAKLCRALFLLHNIRADVINCVLRQCLVRVSIEQLS